MVLIMALMGSKHARNRTAAQDAEDWAEVILLFYCGLVLYAKNKPLMKSVLFFVGHSTVVDVAFDVSEDALEPIVGVGHSVNPVQSEHIRQIEPDTGHCRTQCLCV